MNPDPTNEAGKIRITLEDLNSVEASQQRETGDYGSVSESPLADAAQQSRGSLLLKSWVYLGLSGLAGTFVAWAICEPWFVDGLQGTWANHVMIPLLIVLMCVGLGVAESIVERSVRKALTRGLLSLGVGAAFGLICSGIGDIVFNIGLALAAHSGEISPSNPALWFARGVAWMTFGLAGGFVYGIVGQSARKCLYGIAGGVLGAGLGGFLFDPIAMAVNGGGLSRLVGMSLFGGFTGVAMGLVESALKDRWLYVAAGPLAGKQFILYKPVTTIGSSQSCDIYLFKDPQIQPLHASIELNGPRAFVRGSGPISVGGRAVKYSLLGTGDSLQIGRYAFLYRDRERASK